MTLVLLVGIGASALFAWAAAIAARRCHVTLQTRGAWIAGLAIGPSICAAASLHHAALIAATIAVCAACVSAQTDVQCGLIFDSVTLGALAVLLLRAAGTGTLPAACIGCVALAALLGAVWVASGGRGMGLGDVKFAAVMGAAFGCAWGVAALGAAFISGGMAAAMLLLARRLDRSSTLPLAPFLTIGCVFATAMGGSLS